MAIFTEVPTISVNITMSLTEKEARALWLLSQFNHEVTCRCLSNGVTCNFNPESRYPEAAGLKSLLESSSALGEILNRLDDSRKIFGADAQSRTEGIHAALKHMKVKNNAPNP